MKWYDYAICLFLADLITAHLMVGSVFVALPILSYYIYEDYRKQQVRGDDK